MGLLDSIIGQVTGQQSNSAGFGGGGAASMLMPALMALMAAKSGSGGGLGGFSGGGGMTSGQGGGLGGMLGSLLGGGGSSSAQGTSGMGGLGSMLGAGGIAGGLGQLVQSFEQNGHGAAAQSWVGNGPNQSISPDQVGQALGPDTIDQLASHTGMPQESVLSQLSQLLPQAVHQLTPAGRLPTASEAEQWV